MRRGVWIFPNRPAGELVEAVVAADELGLDEVWLADEGVAREPVPVLAAAAARTARILLATGITSPVLRHPGAIASSMATLDELSGGRAVCGLGAGGHLSLGPFGLAADRPVGRMREAVRLIRAVHAGRDTEGYEAPDHAMPPRSVPIWIGARGPQLVRLAAETADGLFLSGCSPDDMQRIISDARSIDVAVYQSATDRPSTVSEHGWDAVGDLLAAAVEEHRPASIGINLVGPAGDTGVDLVAQVARSAEVLAAVAG